MKRMLLLALLFNISIAVFGSWLTASVVTSGIKAFADKCGHEYTIEKIGVSGDWFCPDE
jgi:hypothetical protein